LVLSKERYDKMKQKLKKSVLALGYSVFILFALWAGFYPRTDIKGTNKLLIESNYKPINVGGHAWFTSGRSWSSTLFKAISSKGDTVSGYCTKVLFGRSALFFD